MKLRFLHFRFLIILLVLVGWPDNSVSAQTVCAGGSLTGTEVMDLMSTAPGQREGGNFSLTSTVPPGGTLTIDDSAPSNENFVFSGFEAAYTSYTLFYARGPGYSVTINVSGTAPTVTFSSPDPSNLCSGNAIDLELTLSGVDGNFDVELTTDHPDGNVTSTFSSSVAGDTHTLSYTLNANASFEITSVVDNSGTGCDVAPADLPGPISFNVLPNAAIQTVTGTSVCAPGSIGDIELQNSEVGVEYRLMYDDGTNPPFAVQTWTSAAVGAYTFSPVSAVGSYYVQATGCIGGVAVDVDMNGGPFGISNAPTVYTISTSSPACVGSSLSLGGVEPDVLYYLLRNGSRTGAVIDGSGGAVIFGGLSAGDYRVEAERNGCVRLMDGMLRVQAYPQQFNLTSNKNYFCSVVTNSGVDLSLSGSQSGIKYQLQRNTGSGFSDYPAANTAVDGTGSPLTPAWQNVPEGTYKVVARTTAGCLSEMSGSPNIIALPPPTAEISVASATNRRCEGTTADFRLGVVLTGVAPFSFDIENDAGLPIIPIVGHPSTNFTPLSVNPDRTVRYFITNLSDASGCAVVAGTGSAQFFVDPLPSITFSPENPELCYGSPDIPIAAQGAGAGGSYSWSDGMGTGQTINVSPPATQNYTVTAETVNNCVASRDVTVTVHPLPVLDFSPPGNDYSVCENGGIISLSPVPTGGSFSGTGIVPSTYDFDPAAAGSGSHNITYSYQDGNTCTNSITKSIVVTAPPAISISGLQGSYCADEPDATITGNPTNNRGQFTLVEESTNPGVIWSDNGNGTMQLSPSNIINVGSGPGTYTIRYTYSDLNGCVSTIDRTTVVQQDLGNIVRFRNLPVTSCQTASPITLQAYRDETPNVDITTNDGVFSGPGITDNSDGTAVFDPGIAGNGSHTIYYNYTDPGTLCTSEYSETVQVGTVLDIPSLNALYCLDDGNQDIYGTPYGGTLKVYRNTVAVANLLSTSVANSDINPLVFNPSFVGSGTYIFQYELTDGTCTNTIEETVYVHTVIDPTFDTESGETQFCETETNVKLDANQPGGSFSGPGVSLNVFNPSLAEPGTHTITYTINTGACTDTHDLSLVVVPVPTVDFTNLNDTYCENETDFKIAVSNMPPVPSVPGAKFSFSSTANAAGKVPIYVTSGTPLAIADMPVKDDEVFFSPSSVGVGTYFITYTYDNSDINGCVASVTKAVEILEAPGVNFGVHDPISGGTTFTDPLKFCQNADPVYLRGNIFTDPGDLTNIGSGFYTGVGIDNDAYMTSSTDGYALFDPTLVSVGDDHSIKYTYTHYNGCVTERTRTYDILPAPITHYNVVSDPVSGIYCFQAPPVDPATYGVEIGLEYSQPDVTYHLLRNGALADPAQTVAGAAAGTEVNFPNRVTEPGTYTVRAVFTSPPPSGTCSDIMAGSVEVRRNYVTGTIEELRQESCDELNDGYLRLSAGGGTAPYVFTLRDAIPATIATSSTGEFSGLEPGTYTVFIEDAAGCDWTSGDITVNPGSDLTLDVISTSVIQLTCNGVNNASFTVEAGGLGSSNYEFRRDPAAPWVSHGSDTYTFTDLAAGTYVVSVRDADSPGCQASETVVIDPEPAAITLVSSPTVTHVGCSETPIGAIVIRAQGGIGSGAFDYVLYELKPWGDWVPIKVESENVGVDATFSGLNGGEYRVDITDANGCGPLQVPITIDAAASLPVVQLSGDGIVHVSEPGFSDGSIQIAITGGEVPYNIVWTGVDGLGSPIAGLVDDVYRQENLVKGTYKVVVTDDNNCPAELSDLEVIENPDFDIVVTKSHPGPCYGSSNGEINLGVTGGVLPYQSLTLTNSAGDVLIPHSSGGSFANYNNLPASNYTAVAIDDRGVSVSEPIELVGPTAPVQLAYIKTDAACYGEDGGIEFSATGGTPTTGTPNTYTYSIIPTFGTPLSGTLNEGGNVPQTLPAGNYQLTVTDGVTCFDAASFTINEPSQMGIVVEDVQNVKCFGDNDGEISVSVSGRPGGTAFTYVWESGTFDGTNWTWTAIAGETSATLSGQAAGHYQVTATELLTSCPSVPSGPITISQPLAPMVVTPAVNNITTCHGDNSGSIVLSVTGGTAPYIIKLGTNEYLWDGLNPYVLSDLSVGTYHVEVVDANGCSEPLSESVSEPDPFVVSDFEYGIECDVLSSGFVAFDISGGLQVSGINAYHALLVRNDNNQVYYNAAVGAFNDPLINSIIAGTYTIRITDANSSDPSACLFEQQFELRNISVSANVIHPICDGQDNGSLEAFVTGGSGDFSITWTMPDASVVAGYMIDGLEPGTYGLTVRDNINGCDVILDPIVIDYAYTLAVDTDKTDVSCFGGNDGSATAIPSGGTEPYFYLWERLDGATWSPLTNNATLSKRTAGTYRVTVTDVNNCEEVSANVVIGEPADFNVASITYSREMVSCVGGADGSFEVQVSGGSGNFEYSIDAVNWQILPTFDNLAAGSYLISVRDMDRPAPYCPKYEVATATILEANTVFISLDNQVNVDCYGEDSGALTISATGGTGPYTYQWFVVTGTGNIPLAGETSPAITGLEAGDYFVQVRDDNSCLSTSEVYTLTQPAAPLVVSEFNNLPVSAYDGNDGSITVAITGGTPGYSIAWTGIDYEGNDVTASLTQNVVTLNNLKSGVYIATVTDNIGCPDAVIITVSQPGDALTLSEILAHPEPCNGATNGSIELTAAGGVLPYTFTLIRNPGTEIAVASVSGNKSTYNGLAAGFYTARVQDANGNVFELPGLELIQPDPVEISYFAPTNISCYGAADGSIQFSIEGGNPDATNGYSYILRPENGTDIIGSGDVNISEVVLEPDNYTLRVFDASNVCFAERSFTLTQPDEIVLTETITPVSCNGLSDGSIRINVSGGIGGGYTYEWFVKTGSSSWDAIPGSNTAWLQNQATGTYKVEVAELGGAACSKESAEFELEEPAVLTASATPFEVNTCPADNSGSITVEVSGGVAPYVVDYGTGTQYGNGPEFFIEDLLADDYTIVVTDNNGSGCQTVATATVDEPAEALSVTPPVVTYSCALPSSETYSVSFDINGGVGMDNGTNDEFSYSIEVTNLLTSGKRTKTVAATIDQPVAVNLDDLNLGYGNYRLVVTDAQAAASASCAAVEHNFTISGITVTDVITPVSCAGATDGAIDITVTGGSGNFDYDWVKDGVTMTETSQDLSGLSDGEYTLTITDLGQPGRCLVTRIYTVGNAKDLVVESSISPVKCFGGNDGAIRITGVANAAPGLSYFWNGSAVAGSNELTGLADGDYSVEIIDGDGCSITEIFTVTQPVAALSVGLSAPLDCATDTRSIIAVEAGGTAPFTATSFAWSGPGAFTRSADGRTISGITVGGEYTVQVTDAYGCSVAESIAIDGAINLVADVTSIDCNGGTGGNILLNVSGGSGDYTYVWTKAGDATFSETTKDIVNLGWGTYSVTVSDNLQDCDATTKYSVDLDNIVVSQPSAILMDGNVTNNECYGGAEGRINLHTVTGGTAPYSFIWTTTDGSGLTAGARDQSGLTAGTYTVQVRDGKGCLSSTQSFKVTELPELVFVLDVDDTNCANENKIEITSATGGSGVATNYQFIWDGPGATVGTAVLKENLPGGTYTITMVDMGTSARCFLTQTVELTRHLKVLAAVQPESCLGSNNGVITLDVSGGTEPYSFVWDAAPGIEVNDRNQAALPSGTYNVTVTDSRAGGGCPVPLEVVVPLQYNMQLQAAIDNVECFDGSNGAIYVTVLNGSGDYTYQWTKGAFSATTEDIEDLEAGDYTLQVTDNVFGCTVTGVYTVEQPAVTMAIADVDVTNNDCFGDTIGAIDINVTGGTAPYTYQWTGPGNLLAPTDQDQTALSGGDYYVSVTDANGCELSNYGPIPVSEPATPVTISLVEVTPVTALNADDGTITVQISGGTGSYTSITWLDPAGVVIPALEGSTFADELAGGAYTIQAMDANSCSAEELEVFVYEPDQPLELGIEKQASGPCHGSDNGKIFVTVKGGELPYQSITLSDGTGILQQLTEVNSAIFDNLAPGDYTVSVIDAFGSNASDNVTIHEVAAPLSVTATVNTHVDCRGGTSGEITARVTGGISDASGAYQLILAGGPAGTSEVATVAVNTDHVFDNLPKGTYTVRVIDDSNVLRVAHDEIILQNLFGNEAFSLTNDCSAAVQNIIVRQPEAMVHLSVEPGSEEVCAGEAPRLVVSTSGWDFADGDLRVTLSNGEAFVVTSASQVLTLTILPENTLTTYTITNVTSATDATCEKGVGTGQAIVVRQALPTATLSGNQNICLGASASLQLNLTGTAPWRVEYSDGTNVFVVSDILSSPHTVLVNPLTDTNYSLVSVEDVHCTGSVSGSATVAVTQPVTVEFSGADSYNEVCGSADFGLAVKFSPTDNGPWQLTYSEVALVNGLPSGTPVEQSIAVSATMLNADGEYEWTVAPSASTRYRIVSVMSHGCEGLVTGLPVDLMVRDLPAQPEAIVGSDVVCQGESATYTIPEIPNVSAYVWIHPDGTQENSTNSLTINYADDAVGGRLYVYGVDSCGDGSRQYMDITVNKLPDTDGVVINDPADICQGAKRVSFMVDAVPYATTYNWTVPDDWDFDGDGGRQILLDIPDEIMNYSGVITVTPENSCGEAVTPITFDINVRPNPSANAGADVPDHCGNTIALNATAVNSGATGQWSSLPIYGSADAITDVTNPNVTVTGLSQGDVTFLWTVKSAYGCESSDEVTVRNNQLPVNATADNTNVCGGSTTLRGTPLNESLDVTGQWTVVAPATSGAIFSNATLPDAEVSNMPVGENKFRWTLNQNGCLSYAEVTVMNRQADDAVILGPEVVSTCGEELTLTAEAPRTDWGTGQWSLLSGYANIETPDSETTVVSNIAQGNVVVMWTVTNGQCANTASVTLRNDKLTVDAGSEQDICSASTVLDGSVIPELPVGIQGSWHVIFGNASFANGSDPKTAVSNLARGVNVLEWRLTNSGCVSADRVTITNNMATPATVGSQEMICGDTYTLTGNPTAAGESGFWSVVSGSGSFDDANDPETDVTGMDFGPNVYRWTINNNNKCTSSADLKITNLKTFVDAGRDTVVCDNTITMRGNPVPAGMTGTWRVVSGGATLGILDSSKPHIALAAGLDPESNTFAWVIENKGCYSEDEVVVINNRPYPVDGGSAYRMVTGTVVDMEATAVGAGMTGTWILQSGGATILEPNNPETRVTDLRRGENVFWWVVTNGNCSDYFEVIIVNGDVVQANAGRPQTICTNATRLEANDAEGAIGSWTVISGTANFENRYDPRTRVTNLSPGENVLRWTISYGTSGSSSSSSDDVIITNNRPDEAKAGNDVAFCTDEYQLRGNTPATIPENMGTPMWTIISGGGDLSDATSPNTMITNLAKGINQLVYSITKGECILRDTVEIINGLPSEPLAGDDVAICTDSYLLNPNTPTHGTAGWRPGSTGGARFEGNNVYDLAQGDNELIYEIYTEYCSLTDTVIITNNTPSVSYAGQNRDICSDSYQLRAEAPQYGVGTWELVAGSGFIEASDLNNPNATVTGLASGSNRFRWMVDNNGCVSSSEVEIRYNFIEADAGEEQIICEDFTELRGSNPMQGTGTWGIEGGSGTAVFEDPSDPLTRVTNLDRGENVLTWTITNRNCSDESKVVIINNKPTVPNAGDDQALCDPTTVLQGNVDVVGQGRWTVRSGSTAFTSATHADAQMDPSANVSGLTFGPNILRWSIENEGCVLYDDVVIEYNRIDAQAGNDRAVCADEVVLSAQSPLPGTGSWSVPGGQGAAVFESPTSPTTKVTNLGRGNNTLRWTVWHKGCQTYNDVVVVNQMPSSPYAGNEQIICRDFTTLDATAPTLGSTGYWRVLTGSAEFANGDETVHNASVTGLAEGDNIFVWTTQKVDGCTLEDQVLIRNNEPSDPYAGADYEEVCSSTFTLKASTPDYGTGIWSFVQGGGNLSDPNNPKATITTLARGTNVLRWTVSQGQCQKISQITLVNNTPTTANAGPDIEDCKDIQTLDANVPVHFDNAYWERISGYGELDDLNDPKTIARNLAFGPNEFQWVIENGACTSTDRVVIFNKIPDKAFAGSDQLNVCDTYTVLNANDPETGTGKWSVIKGKGTFDDAAQYNSIVRNLGFGENIYRWEVAYGECSTVDEVAVVSYKTEAYAGEGQVVYEPEAVLNANNAGDLNARWIIVGTSTATFEDETFFNTPVYNLSEGINTFGWEIDVNGCISYDQVSVDFRPVPDAGFITNVDEGCYPLRVQFTNYSVGGSVYQWRFGDGSTSADRNPVHTYTQPGDYTVQLNAPGPDGMDGVFTKQILVYDHPVADFTVNPTVVYVPGENARFYDLSTNAVSWNWDFGDGNVSAERNPTHQYSDEGVYDVMLAVSNTNECRDTLLLESAVTAEPKGFVVFPNAFKPRPGNASGQVDPSAEYVVVFKPAYRDVDSFILEIFNRWGQKIFETNDIENGWDGMYEGQMAPQAVYIYKATGKYYNGREFRESGSVLLVR
jgi:PKD repeat protein